MKREQTLVIIVSDMLVINLVYVLQHNYKNSVPLYFYEFYQKMFL
jgi:predicted nucleic-acid-binding protein